MESGRYLCSDLIVLRVDHTPCGANLEEIWTTGAVVDSEIPLENGASIEMEGGSACFSAVVTGVESHEFGWRIELQFSPLTPWNPDLFRPLHLFDPSSMKKA